MDQHARSWSELHELLFAETWDESLALHRSTFAYRGAGMVPVGGTADGLKTFMASELVKWTPAAEKIQPE